MCVVLDRCTSCLGGALLCKATMTKSQAAPSASPCCASRGQSVPPMPPMPQLAIAVSAQPLLDVAHGVTVVAVPAKQRKQLQSICLFRRHLDCYVAKKYYVCNPVKDCIVEIALLLRRASVEHLRSKYSCGMFLGRGGKGMPMKPAPGHPPPPPPFPFLFPSSSSSSSSGSPSGSGGWPS